MTAPSTKQPTSHPDFRQLDPSDVLIVADGVVFAVSRYRLMEKSEVFRNMLQDATSSSNARIEVPEASLTIKWLFWDMQRDSRSLGEPQAPPIAAHLVAISLLKAADKYAFFGLASEVCNRLLECTFPDQKTAYTFYALASNCNLQKLREHGACEFIKRGVKLHQLEEDTRRQASYEAYVQLLQFQESVHDMASSLLHAAQANGSLARCYPITNRQSSYYNESAAACASSPPFTEQLCLQWYLNPPSSNLATLLMQADVSAAALNNHGLCQLARKASLMKDILTKPRPFLR